MGDLQVKYIEMKLTALTLSRCIYLHDIYINGVTCLRCIPTSLTHSGVPGNMLHPAYIMDDITKSFE